MVTPAGTNGRHSGKNRKSSNSDAQLQSDLSRPADIAVIGDFRFFPERVTHYVLYEQGEPMMVYDGRGRISEQ